MREGGAVMLVVGLAAVVCSADPAASALPTTKQPNVLILFVDDWGWGDLGANCLAMADVPGAAPGLLDKETACDSRATTSLTPRMDSLAAGGVRLTDFHAGASVCTPSRAALQTGRMGARTGVTSNFSPGSLGGLPLAENTIAELLRPAGYATVAIGKWHLGPAGKYQPTERGYDRYLGIPESHDYGCSDSKMGAPDAGCLNWKHDRCPKNKHDHDPMWDMSTTCHPGPINPWNYSIPLIRDEAVLEQPADIDGTRTGTHLSQKYAEFASDFIANSTKAGKPFLVYIGFSHMHVPIVYSGQYMGKSGKGLLGDALMELDASVGVILDSLDQNKATEDTIIWLTGDNGPPEDQCDWGGSKGPFMGAWQGAGHTKQQHGSAGKMTVWEAGHREVGVVRFPRSTIVPGSVSHALTSTLDIVPTIAKLAGVALPTNRTFDGLDIGNVLFEQASTAHTGLFHSVGGTAFTAPNTTLFEAVRVTGHGGEWLKALFHVATMPPCCRGPDGDANTPYNRTCGKTTMAPLWLQPGPDCAPHCPLLFNLTADVAESRPLDPAEPGYAAGMELVETAIAAYKASLAADMRSHPDMRSDLTTKICCNPDNIVCRCEEI